MDRFFGLTAMGTTWRREAVAGLTTFLAMAYILFVNASILADAGMDPDAVFVATALASAVACLIMGLWANYPIALAPGMGLNAFFAYTVVLGMGIPWETALAGVLVSGILFLLLTLSRARERVIGAVLGTSTTTAYIESASGVAAGGRTGLTSVFVALLFLVSLFFSPLLSIFLQHPELTAPALIIVGVLMASAMANIDWHKAEYAIPAFVTIIAMPLTFSIAHGIALGFVLYPLTKLFKGQWRDVHPLMYALFVVFIIYFIWGH